MSELEIITFGCRLNAYEFEVMREQPAPPGWRRGDRQYLRGDRRGRAPGAAGDRQARRERPDAKIIVTGCAAQIDPARFAAMDEVDHVIGNQEKTRSRDLPGLSLDGSERVRGQRHHVGARDRRRI